MDDEGLSLAVSHNGQYFATGGAAAVVKLWGYDEANLIFEGTGHSGVITGLRQVPQQVLVEEAAAAAAAETYMLCVGGLSVVFCVLCVAKNTIFDIG